MKWLKPYLIGMAVGIATARITGTVFRPFDEACARKFLKWVSYADLTPPPNVHTNGIGGAFDEYGVWTNTVFTGSGWYTAAERRRKELVERRRRAGLPPRLSETEDRRRENAAKTNEVAVTFGPGVAR